MEHNQQTRLDPPDSIAEMLRYSKMAMDMSWLVGCFGSNGPLRQYFSLYRSVSHNEGERGEKG